MDIKGIAYAEKCIGGMVASKAIDGNLDTYWESDSLYSWWIMDLGDLYLIDSIFIDISVVGSSFSIEVSKNRAKWTFVAQEDTVDSCCRSLSISEIGRYIRIIFTNGISRIRDFKAFGNLASKDNENKEVFFVDNSIKKEGFSFSKTEIESGWNPTIATSKNRGMLCFSSIAFEESFERLLLYLGFPFNDKHLANRLCVDIEVRIDSPEGKIISSGTVFRQWKEWTLFALDMSSCTGIHDVYFIVNKIDENQMLEFCFLSFESKKRMPKACEVRQPYEVKEVKPYVGLLHSHTAISDGVGSPEEAYEYAREIANLDFLGITEHANLLDSFDCNDNRKLNRLKKTAEQMCKEGVFCALYGTETTWYNQFGHMNIYSEDIFFNASEIKFNDVNNYYDAIKKYPNSINQWNHPWSCGNRHLDHFQPYDKDLDKIMYLLEMNPIENQEQHGLKYYFEALDNGYHVAPCGSQDNHHCDWGTLNDLRTVIYAEKLTPPALENAIRLRRVGFTCSPALSVVFKINGFMMGSCIKAANKYEFDFTALNKNGVFLREVEVWGNGETLLKKLPLSGSKATFSFELDTQSRYFFLRVTDDTGFAVTSPVWIEKR